MKARFLSGVVGMVMAGALSAAPIISEEITHFSFSGSFSQDNNVALFRFELLNDAVEPVYIVTYGYGGGESAVGSKSFSAGGFDPMIFVFDYSGLSIGSSIIGEDTCFSAASAIGGNYGNPSLPNSLHNGTSDALMFDACLSFSNLTQGTYFVGLSQSPNFINEVTSFNPFAVDFFYNGQGNFTSDFCANGGSSFCDLYGNQRTSRWALDILNVNYATQLVVPVPSTLALLMIGLFGLRRYLARPVA